MKLTKPKSAEEEIRLVFSTVGKLCQEKFPAVFAGYKVELVDGLSWFKTENGKV